MSFGIGCCVASFLTWGGLVSLPCRVATGGPYIVFARLRSALVMSHPCSCPDSTCLMRESSLGHKRRRYSSLARLAFLRSFFPYSRLFSLTVAKHKEIVPDEKVVSSMIFAPCSEFNSGCRSLVEQWNNPPTGSYKTYFLSLVFQHNCRIRTIFHGDWYPW